VRTALNSRFRGSARSSSVALFALSFAACSTGSERHNVLRAAIDADAPIVIRQIYGGGSNSGAPFTHDFIELFNRSSAPASLAGWSVQYASATGTGNFGANSGQLTELPDVTLEPGQSFLIQESGGTVGSPLPSPDVVDATPINLSGTAGKVALVRSATTLGCNGGATQPCSDAALALIVDLIGYGSANFAETSAAPALSNTTAGSRDDGGCTDNNDNSADFSAGIVAPRNAASPLAPCSGGGGTGGAGGGGGGGGGTGGVAGGSGGVAGSGGAPGPGSVRIHDIQGASHRSPLTGSAVANVPGIVTQVRSNGFYFEDPAPDADDATSEGVFVFSSSAPAVAVGDWVLVSGSVSEFRPGCSPSCSPSSSGFANLTTTELVSPSVVVLSSGNPLPVPTLLGPGGRVAPTEVVDDDGAGDVESVAAVFAPAEDGIDFYESLEGMRVELRDAVAVGPTNSFGELPVLPGGGAGATIRTGRGGIVVRAGDFNPERVFLDSDAMPALDVGDSLPGSVFAVVDYSFANFKLVPDALPAPVRAGLAREVTTLGARAVNELDVASFNVENLDPLDPPAKFATLAGLVVTNLGSPDLIALEEVQDDNGPTNDGTVSANTTLTRLVEAISAAGGPSYSFRSIDPVDGQDGGEPGGNIRVAFLFRTDRGLSFVDRPGAGATTANTVVNVSGAPQLTFSPGRIAPADAAFSNSRKPLAAEFRFNGQSVFAVANHWNSKGGDQPLFGRFQPPERSSEVQRTQQAAVVRDFVAQISAIDAQARVIVLGDLNDFEFSAAVSTLEASGFTALVETLPESQRYSYVYEGNSQVLDQVMVSGSLLSALRGFDVVHVNAEFAVQASDHDPAVARFALGSLPSKSLIPILECVQRLGPLQWVARYGYDNPNGLAVTRPVGSRNQFLPSPANRGQPTTFAPGRNRDAVRVPFHGGLVVWNLDGRLEPASALLSPICR
jgi:predicted extracellular nuclease